ATPSPAIDSSAAADAPVPTPSTSPGTAATVVTPQPAATPSPAQTSSAPVQPDAAAPDAASSVPTVYGKSNANPRVVLKAKNDTHITVRGANGTVYINRNLKTGDTYQLPNAVGLTLSTTNAGAVEMDLDGQAIGVAGGVDQSAEAIPLDPQAIVDRFHR
ncbi:MAG: DUF4115 domain-containing protein, partial [Rhizomicrobium sp.]